ncbi:hypothetical protein SPBR_08338 [Sporothrix brasiliensis 5110]|uniref:Major facilitator superfamily (MFS) profile domain-containing protein n=1 Tax=Sporothrix brasiliensis 5110 TaxID=1398154 RepID=A0A0C2EJT3_9PEZI|nr:uncharacterized protein SPBR_08338 [Sporothrix brasiliensis 5110]KIH86294.1 hypothetical protein SPBR_08338 [Sporothrix brasiliensis 5110]
MVDLESGQLPAGTTSTAFLGLDDEQLASRSVRSSDSATVEGVGIAGGHAPDDAMVDMNSGEVDNEKLPAEDGNNTDGSNALPLTVDAEGNPVVWDWATDPANPYNWSKGRKWAQVASFASVGFTTSVGTSIMSPAHTDLMLEFGVSSTAAILPLTFYVLALGIGPVVIGGPLSELVGRHRILLFGNPIGLLFTVGAALVPTSSLAGLCALRFFAGFALSPSLAIASGVLTETFRPVERGLPVACFIVTPFLGPGMGPVLGAFATRKGWRWTEWTIVFFAAFSMLVTIAFGRETYHPVLKRCRAKELGIALPAEDRRPHITWPQRIHGFLTVGLIRPLHMLVAEPIVGLSCLYVACEFATLFSFFAAVPYVFQVKYGFGREESGLVFVSIIVGSVLGLLTVILTDVFIYKKRQVPRFHPNSPPPEHRLYAAMIGSFGLPIGLFWFGWSGYHRAHWISTVLAIVPFAWGNICIFISLMQYMGDTFTGSIVASSASANSLARYSLASVFPLFTIQMYEKLGINWASSLLGFVAIALLPVPWLFFKFGERIRAHSRYT